MTFDDLQQALHQREWISTFDDRTLQRARDYADAGRVVDLQFGHGDPDDDDDSDVLSGRIAGSGRHVYICRIEIAVQGHRLLLDTDCTCPVGVDCKHAAAVLMLAAERLGASAPPANAESQPVASRHTHAGSPIATPAIDPDLSRWERWLSSLDPPATTALEAEPQRQFGVLLRSRNAHSPELMALPAWLRPSKSKARAGVLVDPLPLRLDDRHGAVPMPPGGWPPAVAAALVALHKAPSRSVGNQHWASIGSAHVEQALEYLLERYPTWYERGAHPLVRGESLKPELYWAEADDGSQRLGVRMDAADALLLHGASLWYVRPAQGCYGRIDGDRHLLERLQHAPTLQPQQVAELRQRLGDCATARAIPIPVDRGPPVAVREAPIPVLHLSPLTLRRWGGRLHTVGLAELRFDYAGARIRPDDPREAPRRINDGHVLEIQRDPVAEQQHSQQLQQSGMVHLAALMPQYNLYSHKFDGDQRLLRPHAHKPPLPPEDWHPTIAKLEKAGFRIEYATDFPRDELVDVDDWYGELAPSGNAWFDVALGIEVNGERIDLLPVLRQLLADRAFPRVAAKREKKNAAWRVKLDPTRSVELPLARLRALIEPLLEWLEAEPDGEPRVHKSRAAELDAMGVPWQGGDALRAQLQQLQQARKPARAPRGFKATLRPYQCDGLAWLQFLGAAGLGGILADDMGLGKTVQVLAHILTEKQHKRLPHPALVVAPTSLVGNWASESARFAPRLKVLVIHGADRAARYDDIAAHDLVITTYPLLPRDRDKLVEARFSLLVLDEAQAIKNARSQAAQVVREIPATRRLAMTGTPLENHLGELWAQFDAVEPGLLGSDRQFRRQYRTPIEKHGDVERQQRLNRRIGALLLRRRKDDVLTDLPAKNEIVRTLELAGDQRALYETLRLAQHERVREAVKKRGFAQAGIIVLDALLKLRQACCDPRLVKLDSARKVRQSAKLDALLELLDGLLDEGRRVLVFSQFTEMLGLVEAALDKRRIRYQTLTGQTPGKHRAALVERFQDGKVPVFLISLKAGGVGLNLTAADTVIHYDPWWNPAVEAQATDRAHRIGQDKPVFVYRLICAGTVEEKIQALQARKADLARAVLEGGSSQRLRFDEADLAELFAPP